MKFKFSCTRSEALSVRTEGRGCILTVARKYMDCLCPTGNENLFSSQHCTQFR